MAPSALGLTLIILAAGTYLGMIFVLRRFTYRTWLFDAVILIGVVLAVVGLVIDGPSPVGLAAIGLGVAWFPLTRRELTLVGSKQLTVRVGDRLPAFEAQRSDGTPITDVDVVAAAPAVFLLYRGWWCPSTKCLLDEQRRDHERLSAAGLRTFAASVDPPDVAADMQEHVGDGITIVSSFPVAVLDAIGARDRRGAPWYDRLLFRAPKGDIAMPAALVIDDSGRIVYAFRADRVDERARPNDILASLGQ
jgi:peroxiredoxin